MPEHAVGLGDIAVCIPRPRIDMETLLRHRVAVNPRLERRLPRAAASTGRKAIRFPEPWRDSATLAAQPLARLPSRADHDAGKFRHACAGPAATLLSVAAPRDFYLSGMRDDGYREYRYAE